MGTSSVNFDNLSEKIKLVLAYDGTPFLGWQNTGEGRSIEEALQKVLQQIFQRPFLLEAASRTDAGVHAEGQVVTFIIDQLPDLSRLLFSLNQMLPKEMTVREIQKVPMDFHPTLSSKSKIYRYYVCLGPLQMPFHRFWSWHCPYALDFSAIEQAMAYLVGKHDFAAFGNVRKHGVYDHTVRELKRLEFFSLPGHRLRFEVEGDHFLYKMVRNLIGTLVDVGRGKIRPETIPSILASRDRKQAGITAPAHGLVLHHIQY